MKVTYMNGAGNDFMVIDARNRRLDFPRMAAYLCHLTGADGFMAVDHAEDADFRLHFYNADGSRGEMCGNGARCICRFANELGIAGDVMTVKTDAGPVPGVSLGNGMYRVQLNLPSVADLSRKGSIAYVELGDPGVPHAVAACSRDLWEQAEELRDEMQLLRHDPAFPKGANVNYYHLLEDAHVQMLTFERGVEDFTLACGTGCGSTAVTMWLQGLLPGGVLTAENRGGTLKVTVKGHDQVVEQLLLEGPTEIVSVMEIDETPYILA